MLHGCCEQALDRERSGGHARRRCRVGGADLRKRPHRRNERLRCHGPLAGGTHRQSGRAQRDDACERPPQSDLHHDGLLDDARGRLAATDGNDSTWHRGQHIFVADEVLTDAGGTPTGLVLRNPYGSYRTVTDLTRLYFCIGGASSYQV